ncbi:MAG: WD40 repeat domain-containing protein [Lentisphaerae bacterium]|jgi:WD40 repeat protein|nr:WD40 repeat domain-containing protein [Lentisphaerota bacterium]MBT4815757.1 WD40 repeat domain-containing protein [Lentisphaerota bacterium]MBT5607673.1 WD40 repeat domain-containing protein [Lentisphaerota bacterium]MBT7055174.1 WD40 repeat domain-containing protein [Lentisphaerota bacterium]MBT7841320.1 WD40 repeat domain-containing protein [Lentisphaerota bacterium]
MRTCNRILTGLLITASSLLLMAGEDRLGDTLPNGAVQRLGTCRMLYSAGIGDLCYLPDGRGAFAVGGTVEIWDLAAGEKQSSSKVCDAGLVSIIPRRGGQILLLADKAGQVSEWDLKAERQIRVWPTGQAQLRRAVYSPDETRVLTTNAQPPTLKEWDLATGKELVSATGSVHRFTEGIYGPAGKTAFAHGAAGSGPVIVHVDLTTGKQLRTWLKDYYTHSRSIALSPDRTRLLVGSRHKATEWRAEDCKLLQTFTGHHGAAVTSVAYCKNPDQLLTGSRDGSIRRWDRLNKKVLQRWFAHNGHVTRIAVSPDGEWVLSYGARTVAECSAATGKPRIDWERHAGSVRTVAYLPDGQHVVSGSVDGTLRVWDTVSGTTTRVITGAKLGAHAVAVSPDGHRVAAGCKDGVIREFDLNKGTLLRELKGHRGYVLTVAYTHDNERLLSGAGDGVIRIWGARGAKPDAVLEGHRGGVLAATLSADDKVVLSGGRDGTVRLWNTAEGALLATLRGHRGWVRGVAFAGDAEHAVSAGEGGRILSWDLTSQELTTAVDTDNPWYALTCSADGSTAFTAGADRTLSAWDLVKGTLIAARPGHERPIHGIALAPDGRRLVTASEDMTLLVWDTAAK